jgi:hypothetical protein
MLRHAMNAELSILFILSETGVAFESDDFTGPLHTSTVSSGNILFSRVSNLWISAVVNLGQL